MTQKLIIIGGVAAGMSAAAKARRVNRDLEIVVYEKSGYISYGACGFPYFIKGDVPRIEDLLARTPAQMAAQGVTVHVHHEVVEIDPARRTVRVLNHATGAEFSDHWDKLIIAAGASVNRPPIPGCYLPGVFTLRTVEDALAIRRWLVEEKPKHGVIVGASYIGLEMAEALTAHGVAVTIVDAADQVMASMDGDMAALIQAELTAQGVTVLLNQPVKSFVGPTLVREVVRQVAAKVEGEAGAGNGRLRIREVPHPGQHPGRRRGDFWRGRPAERRPGAGSRHHHRPDRGHRRRRAAADQHSRHLGGGRGGRNASSHFGPADLLAAGGVGQ
jgi:NADPH-dependent 2,4-dienoyl-CoA reductase/sulfur reductase-like enzyme